MFMSAFIYLQPGSGSKITLKQMRTHEGKQSILRSSPGSSGVFISSSTSFYLSKRILAKGLWNYKKSPQKSSSLPYRVGFE